MLRITLSANGSLYCCSDGVRVRGAAVKYLSHNASFHSKKQIATLNCGIKHNLCWLTEAQMAWLWPYFSQSRGKPRVDNRRVLSGTIFINCNGLCWCDAPKEYGPFKTVYNRWKWWSDMGVFARIMEVLQLKLLTIRRSQSTRPISRDIARPPAWRLKRGAWTPD